MRNSSSGSTTSSAKEPVQDIPVPAVREFLLEPLWSRRHVRTIMITMAEEFGVEDRGRFYDPVGALRDVVQNHLLQILALTGLEPPSGGSLSQRRLDFSGAWRPCIRPTRFADSTWGIGRSTASIPIPRPKRSSR